VLVMVTCRGDFRRPRTSINGLLVVCDEMGD